MGLDILHCKLTLTPSDKENYILVDDWETDCNVPLVHYQDFITDVGDKASDEQPIAKGNVPLVRYHDFITDVAHAASNEQPIAKGIYYEEVGYQRKGMSNEFYEYFEKYSFWGKKEDVEFAASCVYNDEWYRERFSADAIAEMRRDFQQNFVDNFVFGESLLLVSS